MNPTKIIAHLVLIAAAMGTLADAGKFSQQVQQTSISNEDVYTKSTGSSKVAPMPVTNVPNVPTVTPMATPVPITASAGSMSVDGFKHNNHEPGSITGTSSPSDITTYNGEVSGMSGAVYGQEPANDGISDSASGSNNGESGDVSGSAHSHAPFHSQDSITGGVSDSAPGGNGGVIGGVGHGVLRGAHGGGFGGANRGVIGGVGHGVLGGAYGGV